MAQLIQIGNSKGVRIPQALIEQAGLEDTKLEFKITKQGLLIKPIGQRQVRQGWQEAIKQAQEQGQIEVDQTWLDSPLDSSLSETNK